MLRRQVLLIAFATLHLTVAFNNLITPDKESIFKWKALVKAGTNLPQPYASQFVLYGQIHIQPSNDSISVKISDLSYQLYNGILNHVSENEAQNVSVPPEFKQLEKDFSIVYNSDGLVHEIITEPDEKTFSLNIKRSVATVFQLNNSVVNKEHKHPEAFDTKEDSIYGYGNVNYNIVPKDKVLEVTKLLELPDPEVLYTFFSRNTGDYPCDAKYEQMIMQDNVKKYRIIKDDAGLVVDRILSIGSIVYYPYKAKSDYQFIETIQEFDLEEVVPIKTKYFSDSPSLVHGKLLNVPFTYNPEDPSIIDITNGRQKINYKKLISQVKHLLEEIPQYLNQDHIHAKESNSGRRQTINRLQRLLVQLSTEKLEEVRQQLPDHTLNAFYHILPIVGTKSSVVYIKNLIVSKKVEDTIAVTLLAHIHDTLDIFAKPVFDVEELIHLNDSFSWEVRKVAILAFGNLIYKQYNYAKTDQLAQERFEKYVIEYINRIKQAKEYKEKATYLIGLRNMKLPVILKYVVPPFTDDLFENHHLRMLGLWAIAPILLASRNPNTIMEAYWPILTNPQEYTELRIIAYYYIIISKPSYSTLRNILFYLLLEKDEELYHFFYSSLKELSQTTDPCRQELRTQAAQILKFSPPPNHGTSSASFANYRDVNYGFGEGIERYYISANTSSLYGIFFNSHHFNKFQEEYMIYVKTHSGTKGKHLLSKGGLNSLETMFQENNPDNADPFIEGAVLKRDQCINVFYFDKHDAHKAWQLLQKFSLSDTSLVRDTTLQISYHWYHRALLPTDLGIPAVWEFLMPLVQQHKIKISRNLYEKRLEIDNRHVSWSQYRHGLSFYNPVADVWQGINRIHSYDAVFPINIEFAVTIQPLVVNIHWRKQENELMNVAGVRSHVHQAVFVDDGYGRGVLQQSSPSAKNYQVVSYGKQYRHDYTLVDYDDLNTGHKWYIGVYDSNIHVSKGSFKHQMELFTQRHTKQVNSLFDYFFLSFENWHTYTVLMPDPGMYGFILRVEPSYKYNATGIDFAFDARLNSQSDRAFLPAEQWNLSAYYGIKHREHPLKRWFIEFFFAFNDGHTEMSEKIEIWQKPDDYKLRIEGSSKKSKKGFNQRTYVYLNNDRIIDIESKGRRSLEQKDGHHSYEECQYVVPYFEQHYYTFECILAHNSLRQTTYNIKMDDRLSDWKDSWNDWWEFIKSRYRSYYSYENRQNRNISENNIHIDLVFPTHTREVDVHIATPEYVYELSGMSRDYLSWVGIEPPNLSLSPRIILDHKSGLVDHCSIYPNYFIVNGKTVSDAVPDEYTLYFEDVTSFSDVYVKNAGNNKLAVKIADGNNTVELIPKEDSYEIILNGKNNFVEEYYDDWLYYYVFMEDTNKLSLLVLQRSGIHMKYNSHSLQTIASPGIGHRGACFQQK